MTDYELIWHIIEQEFPDYRDALEIHNPFHKPLWDENLEKSEQEKFYNYYVKRYDDIQNRSEHLNELSEQDMEALRKKHGINTTSDNDLNWRQIENREADDIIGKTAEQLIKWGFVRRTVYKKLDKPSANILHRIAPDGLPLSEDRIEQIHEEWRLRLEKHNIERQGFHLPFTRNRYTKESLAKGCPNQQLDELIILLLNNEGKSKDSYSWRYWELSKKTKRLMSLFPRIKGRK